MSLQGEISSNGRIMRYVSALLLEIDRDYSTKPIKSAKSGLGLFQLSLKETRLNLIMERYKTGQ